MMLEFHHLSSYLTSIRLWIAHKVKSIIFCSNKDRSFIKAIPINRKDEIHIYYAINYPVMNSGRVEKSINSTISEGFQKMCLNAKSLNWYSLAEIKFAESLLSCMCTASSSIVENSSASDTHHIYIQNKFPWQHERGEKIKLCMLKDYSNDSSTWFATVSESKFLSYWFFKKWVLKHFFKFPFLFQILLA